MDAAREGSRRQRRLLRAYGAASIGLIVLVSVIPNAWRDLGLMVTSAGAAACLVHGRRAVGPNRRRPWTLLTVALVALVPANILSARPEYWAGAAGWLLDAAANLLVLAAALALIAQRKAVDIGGIIDAAVIAAAAGSLLWLVLPHRLGQDESFPAQLNLLVVVFAYTGVLGALLRLVYSGTAGTALWWLLWAIGLALGGNVALALAGGDQMGQRAATILFMGAITAIGLFGLDPDAPRLADPLAPARERLTAGRLTVLGLAIAAVPVAIGIRELLAGNSTGLLVAIQGAFVATFVMARVGLLSAQRARAEQALQHQATHDALTQLPNRQQLVARLRQELALGAQCVVLFCDLDDFKSVNDRFGHDAGDGLLVETARRLRTIAGPPHVVSRFGGDEFVVLLIDTSPDEARAIAADIAAAMRRPFPQAGGAGIGISIGIAADDRERDPEQLIRSADHAMYRAKPSHRRATPMTRAPTPPA